MIKSTENTVEVFLNMNTKSSLVFKIKIVNLGANILSHAWKFKYKLQKVLVKVLDIVGQMHLLSEKFLNTIKS